MKRKSILSGLVLALAAGCAPMEGAIEVENPREFYIVAEYEGPYGSEIFEEYGARLRCQRFAGFSDQAEAYGGECDGAYVLETNAGLSIGFRDERFLSLGARATTENGGLAVLFNDKVGEGEAHISKSDRLQHTFGTVFSRDIAGGFEVLAGEHHFKRGFFYSIDSSVEGF